MRIGNLLYDQFGYKSTVAKGVGGPREIVVGSFNYRAPLGGRGPAEMLARYGLRREETNGSVDGGEAMNPDAQVVGEWLNDPAPDGGTSIFTKGDIGQIRKPDDIDVHDLRYISADGVNTAVRDLMGAWLARKEREAREREGGTTPQPTKPGVTLADDLASIDRRLMELQMNIDGLHEGKAGVAESVKQLDGHVFELSQKVNLALDNQKKILTLLQGQAKKK